MACSCFAAPGNAGSKYFLVLRERALGDNVNPEFVGEFMMASEPVRTERQTDVNFDFAGEFMLALRAVAPALNKGARSVALFAS